MEDGEDQSYTSEFYLPVIIPGFLDSLLAFSLAFLVELTVV
jgi:hypothetical protein